LFTKFPGLATSGRHNFAMITDRPKLTTKIAFHGMFSFHFTVRINSKSFSCAVRRVQTAHPKVLKTSVTTYHYRIARITVTSVSRRQPITTDYRVTWHYTLSNAVSNTACFTCADAETKLK